MDWNEADPEVPESHTSNRHPEAERAVPLASGPAIEKNSATDKAGQPDATIRDDHKPLEHDSFDLGDEIQALKAKILELEQHAKAGPDAPKQEACNPQLTAEMEQYKRMEACLYRHRKEWEKAGGPGDWKMGISTNEYLNNRGFHGPWHYQWDIRPTREHVPPDPFDPSHMCADDQHDTEHPLFDDFDHVIDYGARRERVRQNFEWDMERIFLAEEIDRRRREERQEEHILDNTQSEQALRSEENLQSEQAAQPEKDVEPKQNVQSEANRNPNPPVIKFSRLEWLSFRQTRHRSGHAIEVLEGEPIIDDIGTYRSWYGYSGRRARVTHKSLDRKIPSSTSPDRRPMPERIRIRSPILIKILRTILGSEREWISFESVVLIRPFKAIVYCEQALRDWFLALEKRFSALPSTKKDGAAIEGRSVTPSQDEESSSLHQAEVDASQQLADEDSTADRPSAAGADSQRLAASFSQQSDHSQDEIISERSQEEDHDERKQRMEKDGEVEDEDDEDDETKSPIALEHLKCLLMFIESDISARRTYLDDPSCRKVVFSDLWLLFQPGIEVIGTDGRQAYRVVHTTSARHRVTPAWETWLNHSTHKRKDTPFSITCVYIDFDGRDLGPVQRVFDFKRFDGETEIVSLEVYPLRFHPAKESNFSEIEWKELKTLPATDRHRQRLIDRGAKFLEVAAVKHMYYAGPTLEVQDEVESQVVIDFETAFSTGGATGTSWKPELKPLVGIPASEEEVDGAQDYPCNAECCKFQSVHDDSYVDQKQRDEYVESLLPKGSALDEQPSIAVIPRPLKDLRNGYEKEFYVSDDELVIMSYRVFGFVLRSRKWAKLDLSLLTEAHPPDLMSTTTTSEEPRGKTEEGASTTAFGRLVLEEGQKSMIESLVAQHFRDKQSKTGRREEFDIVRGKGKGLILLLHGAPGVGKTSTAEGVAEIFKKPLFQITCGDLGTTASEVEKALETSFSLANRWDCILLLDEADVFLAQRSKEDFQRNGLVAVFLRVMEYYAGVLFLTTNRVGDFDEAFTSRIHISLYYPELSQAKTESIFKLNMDMIQERFKQNGRKIKIDTFAIGSFATKHFSDHPEARWNGRQIRNACQTALALAEYKAQGNSHAATPRPDVEVDLNVEHFEVVRNAYLEFTKYMNDLYGTNSARRAKESRLRAMRQAENDNTLGGSKVMDGTAFALASQIHQQQQQQQQQHYGFPQAPPSHYHQGMSPQIVHPQTQREQPHYSYQNPAMQQSSYPERSRMGSPPHNAAPDQYRSNVIGGMAYPSFNGSQQGYDQTYAPRQPSPMTTPARQQEHPTNPPWLRDSMHSIYEPSGEQNTGQVPTGSAPPGQVGYTQGNPTWGPPRSQA